MGKQTSEDCWSRVGERRRENLWWVEQLSYFEGLLLGKGGELTRLKWMWVLQVKLGLGIFLYVCDAKKEYGQSWGLATLVSSILGILCKTSYNHPVHLASAWGHQL